MKLKYASGIIPQNRLSIREVADIVEEEGLGYAIMDYLSVARIADEKLTAMWYDAGVLLAAIDKYIHESD